MRGEGFAPSIALSTALEAVPLDYSGILAQKGHDGNCTRILLLTKQAFTYLNFVTKRCERDLHPHSLPYEGSAFLLCYRTEMRATGFAPVLVR
jgi:hypothetical protein